MELTEGQKIILRAASRDGFLTLTDERQTNSFKKLEDLGLIKLRRALIYKLTPEGEAVREDF